MTVSLQTGQSFLPVMGTVEESGQENALLSVRVTRKIMHPILIIAIVLVKTWVVLRFPYDKQATFVIVAESRSNVTVMLYILLVEQKNNPSGEQTPAICLTLLIVGKWLERRWENTGGQGFL